MNRLHLVGKTLSRNNPSIVLICLYKYSSIDIHKFLSKNLNKQLKHTNTTKIGVLKRLSFVIIFRKRDR